MNISSQRFGATVKVSDNFAETFGWKKHKQMKSGLNVVKSLLNKWPDKNMRIDIIPTVNSVGDEFTGAYKYSDNSFKAVIKVRGANNRIYSTEVPRKHAYPIYDEPVLKFLARVYLNAKQFAKTYDVQRADKAVK